MRLAVVIAAILASAPAAADLSPQDCRKLAEAMRPAAETAERFTKRMDEIQLSTYWTIMSPEMALRFRQLEASRLRALPNLKVFADDFRAAMLATEECAKQ